MDHSPQSPHTGLARYTRKLSRAAMAERVEAYFTDCDAHQIPYTIEGLCEALDLQRETILHYEKIDRYHKTHDVIRRAKLKIMRDIVERGQRGQSSAAVTTYLLSSNFGYDQNLPFIDTEDDSWLMRGLTEEQIRELLSDSY